MSTNVLRPLAILAIVAVAGCGRGESLAPTPDRDRVQLDDAGVRAIAQILRLEDQRRYDAAVFDRLAHGDVEVRRRAAMAAGRIGDTTAAPLLLRLLGDDPSPRVRADAAFALGELGDTSAVVIAALREAVPSGWVPVRDDETDVAVEVVQALGKLGTFEARATVLDALRAAHPAEAPNARRVASEALLSIWRFRDGPGRVSGVVRYLDAPDPELRWRAAFALVRLAEPDGAQRLLPLLQDDDHRARALAARGLAAPLVDSAGVRDTARAALTAALHDPHPHVRINAVRALGGYGADAPVDSMAALLRDPEAHVAVAAAGALAPFSEEAETALAAVLADARRSFALRAEAARTLAGAAPDLVLARLGDWADGDFQARYAAARSLTALGWNRAAPLIRRLADDADRRVAVAALVAAGELAADSAAPESRRAAIRPLLEGAARGTDRRRAIVAIRALEPVLDTAALERLREAAGVPDEEPGRAEERSQEFYEDVVRTYIVPVLAGGQRPRARIRTWGGEFVVELLAEEAPLTVHNFVTLARDGFWDEGVWHRVVPNFVLQDGAPGGDPSGGPGWTIRDEINRVRYERGVMGMALAGPDTGGSQWFVTHSPQHHLDGGYTVFGRVVDGMAVADGVLQGHPIRSIRVPE